MSYSQIFQDHLLNPRCAGEFAEANAVAEQINPICGDRLRISLKLEAGRIATARFLAYGCPPTLACGSALAEMIEGLTREEALRITREDLVRTLDGLPQRKQHAALLAIETLHAALRNQI
ncbi:MAG TPA: iron-sulfur cluster assembly scaffold protein [Pyrinomonadaceae bacterium]|jgi:NifU-like protein involved in Fe-S cluster formation|nr:iron-sulfur cluster assembly scaffold protein [Pyrinomonadaceae bacterium]